MKRAWVFLGVCWGAAALGDQCAWVTEPIAQKALELVRNESELLLYCEPCGDKEPRPVQVQSVDARKVEGQDYFELALNGGGEDLAYLYVRDQGTSYRNLGKLAGCGATGVSLKIAFPMDKAPELWRRTYERNPGPTTLAIFQENRAPTLQVRFSHTSPTAGDSRADILGRSELREGNLYFNTPFPGCRLELKGSPSAPEITVKAPPECGALGKTLAGAYRSK